MSRDPLLRFAVLALCLLVGLLPAGGAVHAQGDDDQTLHYNMPQTVSLVTGQAVVRTLAVTQGDSFEIRLSQLGEYACTAVLIDPGQQITLLTPDANGVYTHQVTAAPQSGFYSLVIQAISGAGDMDVLVSSLDSATIPLPVGDTLIAVQAQEVRYTLLPPPDLIGPMRLALRVAEGGGSSALPAFTLLRADTGEAALSAGAGMLAGLGVTLPPGVPFVLVIQPGQAGQQVLAGWAADAGTGPSVLPTALAQTPEGPVTVVTPAAPAGAGPCQVTFAGPVNVRTGPSLAHPIVGAGMPGLVFPVTGRNFDASWWQVTHASGQTGWLSNQIDAVITQGDCSAIPQANFPPAPTATLTLTPAPTFTPTGTPSPMVSPTPTMTPTYTLTSPPVVATLNFSLPPSSGVASLTSGFVPDPRTFGMTGGGPVNVAYLGGGCSGYTTSAPNLRLNYTAGAFPLLRFYFLGNADSTMVINTPGGSYICVDDSFGTLNPTIDFNSPASGAYDVWIGSFNAGGAVAGTLYVTESPGNHP